MTNRSNDRMDLTRPSVLLMTLSLAAGSQLMAGQASQEAANRIAPLPSRPAFCVPPQPDNDNRPLVQIALLLDTSNSMDGLIYQARTQLWSIVNDLAKSRRDEQLPRIQVALYEYGNNNLCAGEGYVRMVLPFTTDLDLVSEKLWSLTTYGGSEFCGHVIDNATRELAWSNSPGSYRAIFIAGNEPFTQGQVDYRVAIGKALAKEIFVNTIHCGSFDEGVQGQWAEGAKLGRGKYLVINQDTRAVHIPTPHDDKLIRLSAELNSTYLPYGGVVAREAQHRQAAQDLQVAATPEAAVARANAKASGAYSNSCWDLVDALADSVVKLEEIKPDELPELLRGKSIQEQIATVEEMRSRRIEIQQEIARTNQEREQFLIEQRKKPRANAGLSPDANGEQSLDAAVRRAIREQLTGLGFNFDE